MRLVDDEQADLDLADGLQEAGRGEALGRDVQQPQLAGGGARERGAVGGRVLLGVDERGAAGHRALERLDLVLHERDERRDDEREVVAQQRGELVAERLAGAGGHDHEQVAVGQRGADRLGLAGPEGAEAEVLAQGGQGAIHGGDDHSAAPGRHRPLAQSRDVWRGAGPERRIARCVRGLTPRAGRFDEARADHHMGLPGGNDEGPGATPRQRRPPADSGGVAGGRPAGAGCGLPRRAAVGRDECATDRRPCGQSGWALSACDRTLVAWAATESART